MYSRPSSHHPIRVFSQETRITLKDVFRQEIQSKNINMSDVMGRLNTTIAGYLEKETDIKGSVVFKKYEAARQMKSSV